MTAVAFGFLALGSLSADESGSPTDQINWQSTEEVRWDPEQRRLVTVDRASEADSEAQIEDQASESTPSRPPRQQVRWDSLEQIQWDPETRRFITSERPAERSEQGNSFDARNYQLSVRDQVEIQVFGEPELAITQRIDGAGQVRIPLLGNQRVAGMSVRETEDFIEGLYVENRILRNPIVTVRVAEYAPREVAVLGAVSRPGTQDFPIERNQMDIVEVVSRAGGFTGIARSNAVSVTRIDDNGRERTFTVDVESMITGSRRDGSERFNILPGDVIWVRERVF